MAKQRIARGKKWYTIRCASGHEEAVRRAILHRVESLGMQDFIFEILVPEVTEIQIRNGEQREVKKKLYPSYVFIQMIVSDESWYMIRNTPNVTGFIGVGNTPVPVTDNEIESIRARVGQSQAAYSINFEKGDLVLINTGPFVGHEGTVKEIDTEKGSVIVSVIIFDRETPVELECTQVKKVG